MIILDTNVLSESARPAPDAQVCRWLADQEQLSVFTTTITVAEVLYGIESLPSGRRRAGLASAAEKMFGEEFAGRILPFDEDAANLFAKIVTGREQIGRPISQMDAMIAAIARSHRASLATRDVADFAHCGVRIINPWSD